MANTSRIIQLIIFTAFASGFFAEAGATVANIQEPSNKSNSFNHFNLNTDNLTDPPFILNEKTTLIASLFTARKESKDLSAAEAAQIAKKHYGGKVLNIDTETTDDGVVYRVKLLLDNGRVKTVTIRG